MLCSVIVPFYNEEPHIRTCAESLLRQTLKRENYEVIFVNNGSKDRSAEIVSHFPDIILLQEPIQGSYAARNKGLSVARGDIIAFTDSDTHAAKDWLGSIVRGIKENGADIALGARYFAGTSYPLRLFQDYENAKTEYVISRRLPEYYFAFTNNMAVRRELFEKVGPFKIWDRAGDTEFLHRCLAQDPGLKVAFLSGMAITHLEILHLRQWYRKINIYGRTNRQVSHISGYRPLNWQHKLAIFKSCFVSKKWGWTDGLAALGLLLAGDFAYRAGALKSKRA
jgi:glycosyltransferase involved in cell wall biosynthesis